MHPHFHFSNCVSFQKRDECMISKRMGDNLLPSVAFASKLDRSVSCSNARGRRLPGRWSF